MEALLIALLVVAVVVGLVLIAVKADTIVREKTGKDISEWWDIVTEKTTWLVLVAIGIGIVVVGIVLNNVIIIVVGLLWAAVFVFGIRNS